MAVSLAAFSTTIACYGPFSPKKYNNDLGSSNGYEKQFGRNYSHKTLLHMCNKCGNIPNCEITKHSDYTSRGFAFVSFSNPQSMKRTINYCPCNNGLLFCSSHNRKISTKDFRNKNKLSCI